MKYSNKVMDILKQGGIGVLPTDTLYGIVGSALNQQTVERIYKLRRRSLNKPMIILISFLADIERFKIYPNEKISNFLKNIWPISVSVILHCANEDFKYLHRGTNTLAFRIPDNNQLLNLLKQTGPLVAPSANFEGEKPASTIKEAKNYFGDKVHFRFAKRGFEKTHLNLKKTRFPKRSAKIRGSETRLNPKD